MYRRPTNTTPQQRLEERLTAARRRAAEATDAAAADAPADMSLDAAPSEGHSALQTGTAAESPASNVAAAEASA